MFPAYLVQQLCIALFCYYLVIKTISFSCKRKRVLLAGLAYVSVHISFAALIYIYDLPQSLCAFIMLAIGTVIPMLGLKVKDLRIILRWATAYSLAIAILLFSHITAYMVHGVSGAEQYDVIYWGSMIPMAALMIGCCCTLSSRKLIRFISLRHSSLASIFIWIGSISLYSLFQYIYGMTVSPSLRTSYIWIIFPAYLLVFAMAAAWVVSEVRILYRLYASEKWNHQHKHAIEYAEQIVREFRTNVPLDPDTVTVIENLARELHQEEARRASPRELPSTRCRPCDDLIRRYFSLCRKEGIRFRLEVKEPLGNCWDACGLSTVQLHTILGHLLQNALEACGPGGLIQLRFFREDGIYQIEISDSGEPFAPQVIERLGQEQITTKKDGKGFGTLEILSTLAQVRASFYLYQPKTMGELKTIRLRFDKANELVLPAQLSGRELNIT